VAAAAAAAAALCICQRLLKWPSCHADCCICRTPLTACLPACLQAFLALSGSATAYSGKTGAGATEAKLAGGNLGLVALAQMRNNARVAVAGSLHMISDAAFAAKATNRDGKR
jgi:hypothetical protein